MDLEEQGVALPLLLRFSDILRSRIESLSERFAAAIEEFDYEGGYTLGVPDQGEPAAARGRGDRRVRRSRTASASSAAASRSCRRCSRSPRRTDHIIVCNGYKDEEFMRLALMGQKLGHQVFIVLEQLSELDVLLRGRRRAGRDADGRRAHQAGVGGRSGAGRRAAARSRSSASAPRSS